MKKLLKPIEPKELDEHEKRYLMNKDKIEKELGMKRHSVHMEKR